MPDRHLLALAIAATLLTAACSDDTTTAPGIDLGISGDSGTMDLGSASDLGADSGPDLCAGACDALVTCSVQGGSAVCGACPSGYTGDGTQCDDVDECTGDPCAAREECTNEPGTFSCACPAPLVDGPSGCLDPISNVVTRSPGDITTVAAGAGCLTATCPAGTQVIGGGFLASFGDATSSQATSDTEWEACYLAPAAGLNYGVRAICATVPGGVEEADRSSSVGMGLRCVDTFCPTGTRAVGGGGRWPSDATLRNSRPTTNGRGWQICVDSDTGTGFFGASVRCVAVDTRTASVTADTGLCAVATCMGDETIVGGGASGDLIQSTEGGTNDSVDEWTACTVMGSSLSRTDAICVGPF